MTHETSSETWTLDGETVDVAVRRAQPPEESRGRFPAFDPGTSVINGIRIDRDVPAVLRDGTTIYYDVHRPDNDEPVPAIVAWSPYGKRIGYAGLFSNSIQGVPDGTYSEGTKGEGPDPDWWCRRGYAIVNPDARGSGNSEGTIQFWNRTEGRDAADLIDVVGEQDWCTGKVGMAGSSWLGISQWFAAAEQPKHLAAIAPWEGLTDLYRHLILRGGIREFGFMEFLNGHLTGHGFAEDVVAMSQSHPFHDSYWHDKLPELEKINVPAYLTAGWSHFHLAGSMEAFRRIGSREKWLRAHRDFEWPDFYAPANLADLRLFFDRYLKGEHNGWELTPRVRIDVMDRGDRDHAVHRHETNFPLPDTEYRVAYLDTETGSLRSELSAAPHEVAYDAVTGTSTFDLVFDEGTEITGYLKLKLWVEARGHDDLELFVVVQKVGRDGAVVPTLVMDQPYPGVPGMLRASHRELDEAASTPSEPVHLHQRALPLSSGEIVPVEIGIWPTSRYWRAGEALRVTVSGHYVRDDGWFEPFEWELSNRGDHVIHSGGDYDSHLLFPVIPEDRGVIAGPWLEPLIPRDPDAA